MKQVGNWWIPAQETAPKVINLVKTQQWTCSEPLTAALPYVKRRGLALDVGTWIGDSTLQLAQTFQQVIGFEANPEVYLCCQRNLADRNITNVVLHNLALTNTDQDQNFINRFSTFSGWVDTKNATQLDANETSLRVQGARLDSFALINVDLLKLDVDSHESFVLLGACLLYTSDAADD